MQITISVPWASTPWTRSYDTKGKCAVEAGGLTTPLTNRRYDAHGLEILPSNEPASKSFEPDTNAAGYSLNPPSGLINAFETSQSPGHH